VTVVKVVAALQRPSLAPCRLAPQDAQSKPGQPRLGAAERPGVYAMFRPGRPPLTPRRNRWLRKLLGKRCSGAVPGEMNWDAGPGTAAPASYPEASAREPREAVISWPVPSSWWRARAGWSA